MLVTQFFMWLHESFEPSPILFLYLFSAADAYCLLDVYLVLSRDPKAFGLPENLCSIPSAQPAKNHKEKKPKEKNKQSKRREVSALFLPDSDCNFYEPVGQKITLLS